MGQKVNEVVATDAARHVRPDTLIVIDPTDIRKPYAEKMPYLATVRDGSTGELVPGYWSCVAVACEPDRRRVIPLHQRLWSAEAPDFGSENAQILAVIDTVRAAVWLGEKIQLTVLARRVAKLAKRFFGIPEFHYYALSDGLRVLLSRFGAWASPKTSLKSSPNSEPQLCLSL